MTSPPVPEVSESEPVELVPVELEELVVLVELLVLLEPVEPEVLLEPVEPEPLAVVDAVVTAVSVVPDVPLHAPQRSNERLVRAMRGVSIEIDRRS